VKRAQEDASRAATEYLNAVVEVWRAEVSIWGLLLVDGLEEPEGPPNDPKPQRNERVRPPHELREPISGPGIAQGCTVRRSKHGVAAGGSAASPDRPASLLKVHVAG
jgi:hypothetical protein